MTSVINNIFVEIKKLIDKTQPHPVYIMTASGVKFVIIKGRVFKQIGKCSRCGRCCKERVPTLYKEFKDPKTGWCKHLKYETVDGKPTWRCLIQWNKPSGCFMYPHNPLNENDIPEYCTYK